MAQQPHHRIFDDIYRGDLWGMQRRVRADGAVLEERLGKGATPLLYAIWERKPAIALWLIEHRGQHDLDSTDTYGQTALHWACSGAGLLSVVQALVGAGANPAALSQYGETPLIVAAHYNHADTVAFLLQQPAVKAAIDAPAPTYPYTALSAASYYGRISAVQLLLDAGANPTIPAGQHSPLSKAISEGRHDVAALFRAAIAEPDCARALHKARALLDAASAVAKASADARKKDLSVVELQRAVLAAAPEYLRGRVAWSKELPMVVMCQQQQQQ